MIAAGIYECAHCKRAVWTDGRRVIKHESPECAGFVREMRAKGATRTKDDDPQHGPAVLNRCRFCAVVVRIDGNDLYHEAPVCPDFVRAMHAAGAREIDP